MFIGIGMMGSPGALSAAASGTYWRLLITATKTALNQCSIVELEMFDALGAPLCSGGTPTHSTTSDNILYPAGKAFDGIFSYWDGGSDLSNFWHTGAVPSVGTPQWIQYQFPSPVDVKSMRITPRDMAGQQQAPKDFKIQHSNDGSTWTDAGTYSLTWANSLAQSLPVGTPAAGAYVALRLNITAVQTGGSHPSAAEIGFRETVSGPNVGFAASKATNVTFANASSTFAGFWSAYAFDGNAATLWPADAVVTQWISCQLPRAISPAEMYLTARNDGSAGQNATAFNLQGSNDGGATWTTIQSFTSPGTWVAGETRTFTV